MVIVKFIVIIQCKLLLTEIHHRVNLLQWLQLCTWTETEDLDAHPSLDVSVEIHQYDVHGIHYQKHH